MIEVVLVLVLLTLILGVAVPSFQSVIETQKAQEPVTQLRTMAKKARNYAMKENRPYQISFNENGFRMSRYIGLLAEQSDIDEFFQIIENKNNQNSENTDQPDTSPPPEILPWLNQDEHIQSYDLPNNIHLELRFWGEVSRTAIKGATIKQWIFQPSGICDPLRAHIISKNKEHFISFNSLTADVEEENIED